MKNYTTEDDDVLPEYDFSTLLKDAEPSKYVTRYREGTNLVLLDPEVAAAFPNAEAVNQALRLVMKLAKISVAPEPL